MAALIQSALFGDDFDFQYLEHIQKIQCTTLANQAQKRIFLVPEVDYCLD